MLKKDLILALDIGTSSVRAALYDLDGNVLPATFVKNERTLAVTDDGGAEIVSLLKTGSAYYAPSASIVTMVEAILEDSKKIVPCAALCQGEYGMNGVFIGVPVKLGRRGGEEIVLLSLNEEEQTALAKSAALVKEMCSVVDSMI